MDQDGRFLLEGLKDGLQHITASHGDYATSTIALEISAGGATPARIILEDGGVIEGRVTRQGQPVSGQSVRIEPRGAARTDAQGQYRLEHVRPGEAVLTASLSGENRASTMDRDVSVTTGRSSR